MASAAQDYCAEPPGAMLLDSAGKTNDLALAMQDSEQSAVGASILIPC